MHTRSWEVFWCTVYGRIEKRGDFFLHLGELLLRCFLVGITKTYEVIPNHTLNVVKEVFVKEKMTPIVAKVLPDEKDRFFEVTESIGTTPSNAIRMFISAFNRAGTFPFEIVSAEGGGRSIRHAS